MNDLAPLRQRIAALVEFGPIRATKAHGILRAEGWTSRQITFARARIACSDRRGKRSRWWPWSMFNRARAARKLALTAKAAIQAKAVKVEQPAPLKFPAKKVARQGRCRHGFTVTTERRGEWLCALCEGEQQGEGVA